MYLDGIWVLRFLCHPVQIGGDDVKVKPACAASKPMNSRRLRG
jgi:hypothetical protein